ncbi:MAG: DUF1294 domain-containing protein [Methanimicrococcus sp.]|nr:DUF1294 domain-containing protein [Methanimicrococcus sp.]
MIEWTSNIMILLGVYLLLNTLVFGLYGLDKAKASLNRWRVPEKSLLIAAFFGPFGAYAGMMIFRHKTQKKPFTYMVPLFLLIHILLIGAFVTFL